MLLVPRAVIHAVSAQGSYSIMLLVPRAVIHSVSAQGSYSFVWCDFKKISSLFDLENYK